MPTLEKQVSSNRDSGQRKLRVAHVVSHPIQYFAPVYREISKRPEIDLTVYFCTGKTLTEYFDAGFGRKVAWDVPLLEGYKSEIHPSAMQRPLASSGFDWRPSFPIIKEIMRGKYDVIWLHGYMFADAWILTAWARMAGIPVLLREEQTLLYPRSAFKRFVKSLILPLLFRNVHGLTLGTSSRAFFREYGTKRVSQMSYCVDNVALQQQRETLQPQRDEFRRQFGITDSNPIVLFSGKLIDKKKPILLLDAFKKVRAQTPCHLLYVGDGALRAELEQKVKSESIPDVHLAGFLNQTQIPRAYTAADIFVLPSAYQETWGIVVNEALNFGLPVAVSDRVGSAADLVKNDENGFVFESGNADDLAAKLDSLVRSAELRARFGARSTQIIERYSIQVVADQFIEACFEATSPKLGKLESVPQS